MSYLFLLKSMLYADELHTLNKVKKVKSKNVSLKPKKLDLRMCRICNDEKGEIPIFNNFFQINIQDEINFFAGVTVRKSDRLPQHICQSCLDQLNGCIMFRNVCQRTNKHFIELSFKTESNNININNDQNLDVEQQDNIDDESYNHPSPESSDYSDLWECIYCKTEFYDFKSYNNHLKDCKKQNNKLKKPKDQNWKKSFLCDICGKTAPSKASLLVHKLIHKNVFPFKCDVCPYQGRTLDLLKVHKRSHMVDKPYKCTLCPKATTSTSNLARHMRHVHSTIRPYKCSYCDKGFSFPHDVQKHIKNVHIRTSTVECNVCSKKFNTQKSLYSHKFKVHKIRGERLGRLPSYLLCQKKMNEDNNINNSDPDPNC